MLFQAHLTLRRCSALLVAILLSIALPFLRKTPAKKKPAEISGVVVLASLGMTC